MILLRGQIQDVKHLLIEHLMIIYQGQYMIYNTFHTYYQIFFKKKYDKILLLYSIHIILKITNFLNNQIYSTY